MNKQFLVAMSLLLAASNGVNAQRVADKLDRGLIVVPTSSGNFCNWRIPGSEYYDVSYNIYRDGVKINQTPLLVSNFMDAEGSASSKYTVAPIFKGIEGSKCNPSSVLPNDYLLIKKATRISNDGKTDITNDFEPNDATIADVDGDGEMEIIVKQANVVNTYQSDKLDYDRVEVYKLNGKLLWWIDCGRNLGDFQHNEINIAAYDWDGDGKAECVFRAADGTVIHMADGTTKTIGDATKNYRNGMGGSQWFVHEGAEYLVYMEGATGKPYSVSEFPLKRLENGETNLEKAWGDGYGHRSSKYFFGAPYLDGRKPSIFLARGIYTRHKMIAYDVDPATHTLKERWHWNNNTPGSPWYGQGYHNYCVADVDWDGRDEIVFGSMVIDDNGHGLSTTGLGHGDAQHCGDFDPYKHGQEIYACNEDSPANNYRDATTSKIYYRLAGGDDAGRSICGNFTDDVPGAIGYSAHDSFISCVKADHIDALKDASSVAQNFRIYWDGDLLEETFNGTDLRNSNGVIFKYKQGAIKTFGKTFTNNDTKATPCFQGDIFGDWREEIIMRDADNNMRIETTSYPTKWRNYTLLDDHQYRNAMVWQMNGYNQPPHASYFLGEMENITVAPPSLSINGKTEIKNGATIGSSDNDKNIIMCETGDMTVNVSDGVSPYIFTDNAPTWVQGHDDNNNITSTIYTHTLTGGAFGGAMRLVKQGDGVLSLPNVIQKYSGNTDIWAGTVNFDGEMQNSRVWLNRFAVLNTDGGKFNKGIEMDYASELRIGNETKAGTVTADSLKMNFGSRIKFDIFGADGKTDMIKANVLKIEKKTWQNGPAYNTPVFEFVCHAAQGTTIITPGKYLIGEVSKLEGNIGDVRIEGLGAQKGSLSYEAGKIYLEIAALREASSVIWTGSEGQPWDVAEDENFTLSDGTKDVFVNGDEVEFNDNAKNTNIQIVGSVSPKKIAFNNDKVDYTISGDSIKGSVSIEKNGAGNVSINNLNTFKGKTTINNGKLTVASLGNSTGVNTGALGTLENEIEINGGTLSNSADITASHPIYIGAKNGTIDVPANLTLAHNGAMKSAANATLIKNGAGTLSLSGNVQLSKLIINEGTVNGSENGSSRHQIPSSVVLNGGVLHDADNMYSYSTNSSNVNVPNGAKASWYLDSRCDYTGKLTGNGELTVYAQNVRTNINGNWSAFSGTLNIASHKTGSYAPEFCFNNSYGLANAVVNVTTSFNNNKHNVEFGNLKGSGTLSGGGAYTIGGLNDDITFSGEFDGSKIVKVGSGLWKMSKIQSKSTGLTVKDGVVNINDTGMKNLYFGNYDVNVSGNGTFAGRGYVNGLTVENGAHVHPGVYDSEIPNKNLKIKNDVNAESGSNLDFFIYNKSIYTYLEVGGNIAVNGTVNVKLYKNYKLSAGDEITLWTANSFSGLPAAVNLPDISDRGLQWDTDRLFQPQGILAVRTATGINDISASTEGLCKIYSISGSYIGETKGSFAYASAYLRSLSVQPGVYVIRMNNGGSTTVHKVTLK